MVRAVYGKREDCESYYLEYLSRLKYIYYKQVHVQ